MPLAGQVRFHAGAPFPDEWLIGLQPGVRHVWRDRGVALTHGTHTRFAVDRTAAGNLALVLDGHLHDTAALAAELGLPASTDSIDVAISAYRRWGEASFSRLDGDYSFALWDGTRDALYLVREWAGLRPLFVARVRDGAAFAPTARELSRHPEVSRTLDPRRLVERLAFGDDDRTQTEYLSIERVRPGWYVRITAEESRTEALPLPPRPALPAPNDDDGWETALRDILDRATAERCIGTAPVTISLSGGLDSTSVAALAARKLAREGRQLHAFTLRASEKSHDVPGRFSDETAHAAALAAAYPNIVHRILPHPIRPNLLGGVEKLMRVTGQPALSPIGWANSAALREAISDLGPATMLTGGVGNFTVSDTGEDLLHGLLARGRVGEWLALVRALHGRGKTAMHLLNLSLSEFLPRGLHRALMRARGRIDPHATRTIPVRPELALAIDLQSVVETQYLKSDLAPHARRRAYLRRRDRGQAFHAIRRIYGIEQRDPTCDAHVVEFGLAVPDAQNLRAQEDRSLIRRAMRNLVPDTIRLEPRRGHQSSDWHKKLAADLPALKAELAALEACAPAREILDLARMRELIETPVETWVEGEKSIFFSSYLPRGLAMGRFLRLHEAGEI